MQTAVSKNQAQPKQNSSCMQSSKRKKNGREQNEHLFFFSTKCLRYHDTKPTSTSLWLTCPPVLPSATMTNLHGHIFSCFVGGGEIKGIKCCRSVTPASSGEFKTRRHFNSMLCLTGAKLRTPQISSIGTARQARQTIHQTATSLTPVAHV